MIIQPHWNKITRRPVMNKKRDYIAFSDIGKPYIDRFHKMNGEPITNEFDERVLRIFDAGRVIEFIVLRALSMAGILNKKGEYVEIPETKTTLRQMGYLDATIGGFVDFDHAKDIIEKHLQEFRLTLDEALIEQKALQVIEGLRGKTLEEMILEVKSINSMSFWAHKNRDEQGNFLGFPHNLLQTYGYMKATALNKGVLLYVSKDDFVVHETGVILGQENLEETYQTDILTMTEYYRSGKEPPKEEEIIYNEREKRFELNWMVGRSAYLTKIYGYKDQKDFEEKKRSKLNEINLALKHLREFEKEQDRKKKDTLAKKITAEDQIIAAYKLRQKI